MYILKVKKSSLIGVQKKEEKKQAYSVLSVFTVFGVKNVCEMESKRIDRLHARLLGALGTERCPPPSKTFCLPVISLPSPSLNPVAQ